MEEWLVPLWHFYVQDWLTEPYKHDPIQYLTNCHKWGVCECVLRVCVCVEPSRCAEQKRLFLKQTFHHMLSAGVWFGCAAVEHTLSCLTCAYFSPCLLFFECVGPVFSGCVTADLVKISCYCPVCSVSSVGCSFVHIVSHACWYIVH